jgi:adenosylcobinamide-GDP ribazoletransferase
MLRGARAAFVFLTRIPVGGFPYTEDDFRWAAAYFPLVGAVIGALTGLVVHALWFAGARPAAIVGLAVSMLLTGAFHEDGLADTADALGGAYDRDKLFVILKDSRIGAFGAAALVVALLLRVALLARLGADAPVALVLAECLSRTPPVWLMGALPYVTPDGARSRPVARAAAPQVAVATLWPLALAAALVATGWLALPHAALVGAVALASALVCGWRFHVRAGGLTGDFLGATQQVALCAVLLALALARAP